MPDPWNKIDCFIMYRNVIQYMTFLLLTIVVYVSYREHNVIQEKIHSNRSQMMTLVHKISHLCWLHRLLVWYFQGSTRFTIQITQNYINYASYCYFIPHKHSVIRKLSFCKVFYKKLGELIHRKLFTNMEIWDASSRYTRVILKIMRVVEYLVNHDT